MAFKSSYHLRLCRLPKVDAERPTARGHNSKLHSEGASFGAHESKVAFKSSCHLRPCWLTKLDDEGALAGHSTKMWPSSLLTIRSHAGYPCWTLKGRLLSFTTPMYPSSLLTVYKNASFVSVRCVSSFKIFFAPSARLNVQYLGVIHMELSNK